MRLAAYLVQAAIVTLITIAVSLALLVCAIYLLGDVIHWIRFANFPFRSTEDLFCRTFGLCQSLSTGLAGIDLVVSAWSVYVVVPVLSLITIIGLVAIIRLPNG